MNQTLSADQIVDAALLLADKTNWESVRLFQIAEYLHAELDDIRQHFREKEDIVDAWFDRADQAMLREAPIHLSLPTPAQLCQIIMSWFKALEPYRRPSRQMILNKLEPGHLHYQWAGALRVSRTVQWVREAARRPQVLPWRALEEAGLTVIYLATVMVWMRDESESLSDVESFLSHRLREANELRTCCERFSKTHRA